MTSRRGKKTSSRASTPLPTAPSRFIQFLWTAVQAASLAGSIQFLLAAVNGVVHPENIETTRAVLFAYLGTIPLATLAIFVGNFRMQKIGNSAPPSWMIFPVLLLILVILCGVAQMSFANVSITIVASYFVPTLAKAFASSAEDSIGFGFGQVLLLFASGLACVFNLASFGSAEWKEQANAHFQLIWPGYGSALVLFCTSYVFTIINQGYLLLDFTWNLIGRFFLPENS